MVFILRVRFFSVLLQMLLVPDNAHQPVRHQQFHTFRFQQSDIYGFYFKSEVFLSASANAFSP